MGQSSVKNMFHHVRRKNVWRYGEREQADFDISLILGYFSWNFLSTMINHEFVVKFNSLDYRRIII